MHAKTCSQKAKHHNTRSKIKPKFVLSSMCALTVDSKGLYHILPAADVIHQPYFTIKSHKPHFSFKILYISFDYHFVTYILSLLNTKRLYKNTCILQTLLIHKTHKSIFKAFTNISFKKVITFSKSI